MEFKIDKPGDFLKDKRKSLNKTLREVSDSTGLSIGYISRIENGSSSPSLEALYKLSYILIFKVEDICTFEDISYDTKEPIPIEDLFKAFQLKIGEDIINDLEKVRMAKLLRVIHEAKWDSELNKMAIVHDILSIVEDIKESVVKNDSGKVDEFKRRGK